MSYIDLLQVLDSTLRLATPLILCAMAGLVSERAGIVDISLEGKLLGGAFAAAAVATITGSAWLGLFAAIASSVLLSMIHGFACITHKGEQIISGIAINILASGATVVASVALFKRGGQTPTLDRNERFSPIDLPGAEALADIPYFGPFWKELISGHTFPVYLALLAVPFVWSRCLSSGGCSGEPALAYGFARSERCPPPWTVRACR